MMSQQKSLSFSCFVLLAWGVQTFADDVELKDLSSRTARSAVSTYQRKVDSAEKDYEKVVSSAKKDLNEVVVKERDKLIDELENALKKETSNGNLEEAVKLKNAIAVLKSQAVAAGDANQETGQLLGFWKIQYNDGVVRYNQFLLQNGQPYALRYVNPREKPTDKGAITIQNGTVLVKYDRYPAVERFNLAKDRLFIEHWVLSGDSSIERYPNLLGIATKVDPQDEK